MEEVAAASPRGIDCLVLHLSGGRTTTIPVTAVAADRDDFARDVRDHARRELQQGRIGVLGAPTGAPTGAAGSIDESADMFASLASFSQAEGGGELPGELRAPLERFFAPA